MKSNKAIDVNNAQIKNVAAPTEDADLATKKYVDDAIDDVVVEGGGFVLNSYDQISELDDYPESFPTDVDDINGISETGKALLEANSAQDLRDAAELDQVNNTADSDKPISAVGQAALDLKANLDSPTFTGAVSGITKDAVGLSNVDNTSDSSKPLSTASTTALAEKASATDLTVLDARVTAVENVGINGFLVISDTAEIPDGTPVLTPIIRIQPGFTPPPVGQLGFQTGDGNVTHNGNYYAGSITATPMTAPSSTAVGDLLVCMIASQTSSGTFAGPAGWTLAFSSGAVNGRLVGMMYYPVTDATALANVIGTTLNFSGGAGRRVATIARVTGVDLIKPFITAGDPSTTASDYHYTYYTQPGIGVSNDAVFQFALATTNNTFGNPTDDIPTWTSPDGFADAGSYTLYQPAGTGQGQTNLALGWGEFDGGVSEEVGATFDPASDGAIAASFGFLRAVDASEPYTYVEDTFNRSVGSGMGTSSINNRSYTLVGANTASSVTVDPTNGLTVVLDPTSTSGRQTEYSISSQYPVQNVEIESIFSFGNTTATEFYEVFVRRQSGSLPGYGAQIYRSGAGIVLSGERLYGTAVGSPTSALVTGYTPGTLLHVRFRIFGDGTTTTLQGRLWKEGDTEPGTWQYSQADTVGTQVPGTMTFRWGMSASAVGNSNDYVKYLKVSEYNGG